jgi:glycosyltransferase involved in cell wall biosynthesis
MPKVSVIIPAYNHEKFVGETIESVLNQTYQDFDLLIADDGSTDRTVDVIRGYTDPRKRLFTFEKNRGACIVANNCIERSKGRYIAILSSDDVFMPDKLEKQVRFLDEHPKIGAVFARPLIIDEEGKEFADTGHFYTTIFQKPNRGRFEWLNYFFYRGNCLCHSSLLIRKECYERVGLYDPLLAQLPDLDLWIRLCMVWDIHILDERLVKFRIRADEANASGARPEVGKRAHYELLHVLEDFLSISSLDDLLRVFPEVRKKFPTPSDSLVPFYVADLARSVPSEPYRLFALDTIRRLLRDPETARLLETNHGYRSSDFIGETGRYDIFNRFQDWYASLYADTGGGFREDEKIAQAANYRVGEFSFTYDVSGRPPIRAVRWDPAENLLLSAEIGEVSFRRRNGEEGTCDVRSISSNGGRARGGKATFDTLDPQFFIPISGDLLYITIRGKWAVESYVPRIRRLENAIRVMETSKSWRLTAPLRGLSLLIKGMINGKRGDGPHNR